MTKAEELYRRVFGITSEDTPELNDEQKVIIETMEAYAESKFKKLNIHSVIMRSEQLGCACKNQPESIFGYTWKTCKGCGKTSLMPN